MDNHHFLKVDCLIVINLTLYIYICIHTYIYIHTGINGPCSSIFHNYQRVYVCRCLFSWMVKHVSDLVSGYYGSVQFQTFIPPSYTTIVISRMQKWILSLSINRLCIELIFTLI